MFGFELESIKIFNYSVKKKQFDQFQVFIKSKLIKNEIPHFSSKRLFFCQISSEGLVKSDSSCFTKVCLSFLNAELSLLLMSCINYSSVFGTSIEQAIETNTSVCEVHCQNDLSYGIGGLTTLIMLWSIFKLIYFINSLHSIQQLSNQKFCNHIKPFLQNKNLEIKYQTNPQHTLCSKMSNKNIKSAGCSTQDCTSKLQAVCFTCQKLYCFKCSMQHAQKYANPTHNVVEIDDSIPEISKISKKLIKQIIELNKNSQLQEKKLKNGSNIKLSPQKFQEQLDEINFMKKQTLKVVQKFFSQISLELVNIWQHYLKKYSSFDISEKMVQIKKRLEVYCEPWNINQTKEQILRGFFREKLQEQVDLYHEKFGSNSNSDDFEFNIPKCPQIKIDDRVLVQLSEVLCASISTKNYTYDISSSKKGKQKEQAKLNITLDNYLHKSVTWLPIFPIKKNHCFLYNIQSKNYEIQQFQQLEYLPDYPKTIIIPNGDIHIIGGTKNDKVIDTHLVFRSSSSEVFKLGNMPVARNPSNSLIYHSKCIYLIGGINEKHQWDQQCYKYLLQSKQWKQIPSMHASKPHQSCSLFNSSIYCFGIPEQKKINIEKYSVDKAFWQEITINNFLSNPFNFAAGFVSCQINQKQILIFGGKKFLQSATTNKRSTDRNLQQQVYVFQPDTNSFQLKGPMFPCLGVQYGEFYPIVSDNKVYVCEYILCKTNPISRWYDNIQVLEITEKGEIESVIILEEN